jgi:hypothetical protein
MLNPPSRSNIKHEFDDELVKELNELSHKHNGSKEESPNRPRTISDIKRDFQLGDIIEFVHKGMEVLAISYFLFYYLFNPYLAYLNFTLDCI